MINSDYFISKYWRTSLFGQREETPLARNKWIQFIERQNGFLWTGESNNDFADHNGAVADFDKKKGLYKFALHFRSPGFVVHVVFNEARPSRARLLQCLELAEELGVHLFRFGAKTPITQEWIDKNYPEKMKSEKLA